MENNVRLGFEEFIDKFVKDTENQLQKIETFLVEFGIEPNLESILSYILGNAWGQFYWHYQVLKIDITPEMENEFVEILRRRSLELRETFIRARHK